MHKSKGMAKAHEWVKGLVIGPGSDRKNKLSSFRTKIKQQMKSKVHVTLDGILNAQKVDQLPRCLSVINDQLQETTQRVFRTAYYVAKSERPFNDYSGLIDLQSASGLDMGILLQSRQVGADICEFIGVKMQRKLVEKNEGLR